MFDKVYANIYRGDRLNSIEIGGTREQVDHDIEEMKKIGLISEDCQIKYYEVKDYGGDDGGTR